MYKLTKGIFLQIKNLIQLCNIICAFLSIMTLFAWLENIIQTKWIWLDFVRPVVDNLTNFMNSIYSFSLTALGTVFDFKYLNTVILLFICIFLLKFFIKIIDEIENFYDNQHASFKKTKENLFNYKLMNDVKTEEKRISKYLVLINTRISKKFSHKEINVDIKAQNQAMNDFIFEKTNVKYLSYNDGFLYCYDDFEHIDKVLEILFKVLKSQSQLDYSICIQAGDNLQQLKKLSDLQHFGKITICADTLLRYRFNKFHGYGTKNVGIFQEENDKTIEVHEFYEII